MIDVTSTKVQSLECKVELAERELNECIRSRDVDVKTAAKNARVDERQHYAKLVDVHKDKAKALASKVTSLTSRTVSAELKHKNAEKQVNRSSRRSDDVMEYCQALEKRITDLENTVKRQDEHRIELEMQLMDQDQLIEDLIDSAPIKVFGKVRGNKKGGASSWPLFVWELILELLVNGTPPTSINASIITFLRRFSPKTVIKELPSSIWTIRRGRTVLLVVVQTLAAYRLARAKKWGQLHTDGTGRRQIAFQDLVLSIEEDVEGFFEYVQL